MAKKKAVEPVGVDEVVKALMRALLQFEGRGLTVETATQACAVAAYEVKNAAIRAVAEQAAKERVKR